MSLATEVDLGITPTPTPSPTVVDSNIGADEGGGGPSL